MVGKVKVTTHNPPCEICGGMAGHHDDSCKRAYIREITSVIPNCGGWVCTLVCGHQIWQSIHPHTFMYCGACLDDYVKAHRKRAVPQKKG